MPEYEGKGEGPEYETLAAWGVRLRYRSPGALSPRPITGAMNWVWIPFQPV